MKFVNITENKITKVMLDLGTLLSQSGTLRFQSDELDSEDTVCVFEGVRNFDFTIVNEFLSDLNVSTLKYIVRKLANMRRCIANSYHDDPAADECVGELRRLMKDLFANSDLNFTGILFGELYNFSAKYITPEADNCPQDISDKTWYAKDRQMCVAASLLSALCIMVIHDFETHFTDVSEPLQVLYPVFEETIRDCGVDGAKEFVERNREHVSNMEEAAASWILEGIYINDCMLHKHKSLFADIYVIEYTTQRILSSKTYLAGKRACEMKAIHEAEAQQRNDAKSESTTETFERVYPDMKDLAIITALMIKQTILLHYGSNPIQLEIYALYCTEVVKAVDKVISDINAPTSLLATRSFGWKGVYDPKAMVSDICNAISMHIDRQKFKNGAPMLPFVNDGYDIQHSVIEGAITDALLMMRRIHNYLMGYERNGLRQPHIPYDTLQGQIAALTTIAPKLNPEFGPLIVSLVLASSDINMQAFYGNMAQMQPMYGQPMYGQPGTMPMYNPYAQKPVFQPKKTDKS